MTLDDAINFILQTIESHPDSEIVPIEKSCGRFLAEKLSSHDDIPPFDNSQVDGYAVNSEYIKLNSPITISQRIPAGSNPKELDRSTTARIFTGAVVPKGSDAVVMQEQVDIENGKALFNKMIFPGQFIRRKGCDLKKNQIFFQKGRLLSAADIGMCASVGLKSLRVFKKLKIGVFSSGDELRQPGEKLLDGQIYDSNRPMVLSLARTLGLDTLDMGCLPDDLNQTIELLANASKKVDVLLTCGGVSVGEEDHIKSAVEKLGSIKLWKIKIKPGKPFAFGYVGKTVFMGMPGNPVSAWVTFALICRPYILKRAGGSDLSINPLYLECDFDWNKPNDRQEFLRGKVNKDGKLEIFKNQNSQILSSICFSEGLIEIPTKTSVSKGDKLHYYPFSMIV